VELHTVLKRYKRVLPLLSVLVFYCFFLCPLTSRADKVELTDFLAEVQAAADQVTSFSSKFTQERHLALFAKPVIFHGRLTIVRPEKLRWEFTDPVPSILVFNGGKGLRCSDQSPPVHFELASDPVMKTVAEQLWLWLGGDYSKIGERYLMEMKGAGSLVITPKEKSIGEYIAAVHIDFNKETKQPTQVDIIEPGGDFTRIIFNSYTLNTELPDVLFTRCGEK